MYIFGK